MSRLIDIAQANYALVETLYDQYKKDPKSVSPDWVQVFEALEDESLYHPLAKTTEFKKVPIAAEGDVYRIMMLMDAYRTYGHLMTSLNPIAIKKQAEPPQLKLENLGFSASELSKEFPTCGLFTQEKMPLLEIVTALKKIYGGRIGFEYMGYQSPALERWIQEKIEPNRLDLNLLIEQKQMILEQLNKSELFETFLHTKFPGQKRFSVEGAETVIPILASLIETGARFGTNEYVVGMAHRGRLNVLVNILNKAFTDVLSEFDEGYVPDSFEGTGDVKYHKGFLSDVMTIHGHPVKITLTPNPSHLESVDPVVEGQVKAKQIQLKDTEQEKIQAILVHGDAALSGQGVVYETLQLYKLKGYSVGGTLHVVINNQIGFTTLPSDSRSTRYCTDIAKAFGAPVFHVNAEDPEACVYAAIMAAQIRHLFHIDVFIDLNCYRKYGHNEGDEPFFTQPLEYKLIRAKKTIRELFRDQLISEGVVEKNLAESLEAKLKKALQEAQAAMKLPEKRKETVNGDDRNKLFQPVATGVPIQTLKKIAESFCKIPEGFQIHPKLEHLLKERLLMVIQDDHPMDWGMAEILAYASLIWEGVPLRLAGQDSGRGTFSHRHALWMDQATDNAYFPLSHLKPGQPEVDVINTPLSEFAALGFEYGYSTFSPKTLVIWEAQFGDFSNGGQVIIDQYISAGEQKWGQKSNITLLLPHGYEGQGPEHSSSRLERYLSLCGNDNWFVCNPTTPAQFFHLLRRQIVGGFIKPLICLTPKALLRYPACVSKVQELESGQFHEVLDDPTEPKEVSSVLFCSGKIYYDLIALREKEKLKGIAIIRIEQIYPFDEAKVKEMIKKYAKASSFVWVQEEPSNMGAWSFIHPSIEPLLPEGASLKYIGRPMRASPASGSYAIHKKEYAELMKAVVDISQFHRA